MHSQFSWKQDYNITCNIIWVKIVSSSTVYVQYSNKLCNKTSQPLLFEISFKLNDFSHLSFPFLSISKLNLGSGYSSLLYISDVYLNVFFLHSDKKTREYCTLRPRLLFCTSWAISYRNFFNLKIFFATQFNGFDIACYLICLLFFIFFAKFLSLSRNCCFSSINVDYSPSVRLCDNYEALMNLLSVWKW